MLQEISIQNFAIIDQLSITFEQGLSVITGETGAGKSMIIDALYLLMGARGSGDIVRHGAKKAVIEGLFFVEKTERWDEIFTSLDITLEDDSIIIRREILAGGKSVCKVNGKLISLTHLKILGRNLLDIHGQHDNQSLLDPTVYKMFLDISSEQDMEKILKKYQSFLNIYHEKKEELKKLEEQARELFRHVDVLEFQRNEIREAQISVEEELELLAEQKQLQQLKKNFQGIGETVELLSSETGIFSKLSAVKRNLEDLSEIGAPYNQMSEQFNDCYYILEDISFALSNAAENEQFDPNRYAFIEDRLDKYAKLKRKYGSTAEEILQFLEKLDIQYDKVQNMDFYKEKTKKEIKQLNEHLMELAVVLFTHRVTSAEQLEKSIRHELQDLYMDKAKLEISVSLDLITESIGKEEIETYVYKKDGAESVQFNISTNPGEPLKPLHKIVSGGELSRIMLAIKAIFNGKMGITSIVFDEVDTGVSGRVAQAMADKMKSMAKTSQVLAITHLPQVATVADQHLRISKVQGEQNTTSSVQVLNERERILEISRMISGNNITEATKEHVRNMMNRSE